MNWFKKALVIAGCSLLSNVSSAEVNFTLEEITKSLEESGRKVIDSNNMSDQIDAMYFHLDCIRVDPEDSGIKYTLFIKDFSSAKNYSDVLLSLKVEMESCERPNYRAINDANHYFRPLGNWLLAEKEDKGVTPISVNNVNILLNKSDLIESVLKMEDNMIMNAIMFMGLNNKDGLELCNKN